MLSLMRGRRALLVGVTALTGLLVAAADAAAAFHLMKVREVFPGTLASPDSGFVELQMTAAGQNLVGGHSINVYDASGSLDHGFPIPANVASGANQARILVGDTGAVGPPDFTDPGLDLSPAGGAICFPDAQPPDCVSWGAFTPPLAYPSPSTPNASPLGISDGMALERTIARGCPSLLDGPDDTNSSAADFSEQPPTPQPNALAPPEAACTVPRFAIKGPRKTFDRTPTFRFTPSEPVTRVRCRLDAAAFKACASPFTTKRLAPGRHKLTVRGKATDDGTLGASSRSFKVRKRR